MWCGEGVGVGLSFLTVPIPSPEGPCGPLQEPANPRHTDLTVCLGKCLCPSPECLGLEESLCCSGVRPGEW